MTTQILDLENVRMVGINNKYIWNPKMGRLILSREYRDFKNMIITCTTKIEDVKIEGIYIWFSGYCDIDAGIKAIIDGVCEKLGVNDREITRLHVNKLPIKRGQAGYLKVYIEGDKV